MAVGVDVRTGVERLMWSCGNYAVVAQLIVEPALWLVEAAEITRGMDVLDVATGTGNVAIPAAKRGASVVAIDLTPELLEQAHARADAAGVTVDWREGDADQLVFADGSFDCVLSTFGVQFAPDPYAAAAELVRVCRPGGVIGVCSWTPEGVPGRYIALLKRHLNVRGDGPSSTDWGDEKAVRGLFADTGLELAFERDQVISGWESLDAGVEFLEHNYGCAITARRMLDPQGRWQSLRSEIRELFASANQARDAGLLLADEYLRVLARKPPQPEPRDLNNGGTP
ncbi:MAG: class I SAM-dependent methyltransferase [Solirubrobacteraceae bacterium]